jgi:hypothetical protein
MLDVHILIHPDTPRDWVTQCLDSVHEAADSAAYPVAVHTLPAVLGHIGQGRAQGYALGDPATLPADGDALMRVLQQGSIKKLVPRVEQITFSGPQALKRGQQVLFLTERASFRLTPAGVELFELAPGIDLQRDVLDQMDFVPLLAPGLATMDARHFRDPSSR